MEWKVKNKLNPIKLQVRKLADPKVSVKVKRKRLSERQVGNRIFGTLATIASAVIPLIISAATSKWRVYFIALVCKVTCFTKIQDLNLKATCRC